MRTKISLQLELNQGRNNVTFKDTLASWANEETMLPSKTPDTLAFGWHLKPEDFQMLLILKIVSFLKEKAKLWGHLCRLAAGLEMLVGNHKLILNYGYRLSPFTGTSMYAHAHIRAHTHTFQQGTNLTEAPLRWCHTLFPEIQGI